jgi:hypothetical protein
VCVVCVLVQPFPWVDVVATEKTVSAPRMHFETVDLNPIYLLLSYLQTVADQKRVSIGV